MYVLYICLLGQVLFIELYVWFQVILKGIIIEIQNGVIFLNVFCLYVEESKRIFLEENVFKVYILEFINLKF